MTDRVLDSKLTLPETLMAFLHKVAAGKPAESG